MYLTVKQQAKHLSKEEFRVLRELCHAAKNLTNQAIYNIRQYYFTEGKYLTYQQNYNLLKTSEHYKLLNSNMAQQILKEVDGSFQSFFGLLKLAKEGKYAYRNCRLPGYLPKDGFTTLIIGFVRIQGNKLVLPFSNSYRKNHKKIAFTIPPILQDKTIKEIRIIPKAARRIIDYCVTHDIGTLVVGCNDTFQKESSLGRAGNQNFVGIPYGRLCSKLEYLCALNGIRFVKQEESYTSKASFWDHDRLPAYDSSSIQHHTFRGKRIHRGLYRCGNGRVLNADVNGALNILRKSNVVSLEVLYARGEADTPVRIRIT